MVIGHPRPGRLELAGIAAIVLGLIAILARLAFVTGVTVDEPSHLVSSYLYWQGKDTLEPGDMPFMLKLAGGWVPSLLGLRLPDREDESWQGNHEWKVSQRMVGLMTGREIRRTFGLARLPMIVFPAGLCLLIWWWGRQILSPVCGVLAAALLALSPLLLGHGALFKNDVLASFAYVLFWYRAWAYWRRPGRASALWLGVAALIAIGAKFSLLVFAPAAPLIVLARALSLRTKPAEALVLLGLTIGVLYAGIHLAWQSRFEQMPRSELQSWVGAAGRPWLFEASMQALQTLRLPPRFIHGAMTLIDSNNSESSIYLLGQVRSGGHPAYFLIAMAVKLNLALQLLIILGLLAAFRDLAGRKLAWTDAFWLLPAALYLGLASMSRLQLGVRLVLPAIAFLALIAGRGFKALLDSRPGLFAAAGLMAWMAVRAVTVYPDYISSFNVLAGGPDRGLEYLSDSNIDWGQDAARLRDVIREQKIPHLRLAYFGMDNPFAHLPQDRFELIAPPWSDDLVKSTRMPLEPGYYAISATLITGQFFAAKYRDYFAAFRSMRPIAKAGNSIFIYRVPGPPGNAANTARRGAVR